MARAAPPDGIDVIEWPGERVALAGTVDAFARALSRESHVLARRPGLLHQQLHNRLQWEPRVSGRMTAERESWVGRPWLQLLDVFPESEAGRRTIEPGRVEQVEMRVPSGRVGIGPSPLLACALSPDGTWVVTGDSRGCLQVSDLSTGTERLTVDAHDGWCTAVAVTPDGRLVVSGGLDGALKVWDPGTGESGGSTDQRHAGGVTACAVTPDGRGLVSGGKDGLLHLWDLHGGGTIRTFHGHGNTVTGCAVSPDGRSLLSTGYDGTVRLWDLRSGSEVAVLLRDPGVQTGCAIGPGGRLAVSSAGDPPPDASFVKRVRRTGRGLDPGAGGGRVLRVWDLAEAKLVNTLAGHTAPVMGCAVGPDEEYVVSAGLDRTVRLWDPRTGAELATLRGHPGQVMACAATSDGSRLVSTDVARTIKVWDVVAARRGRTESSVGHMDGVIRVAVSPDDRFFVSAGADGKLLLWDGRSGDARGTLAGHDGVVRDCAVGPQGTPVVSAGQDGTLRLWDAGRSEEVAVLGHRRRAARGDGVSACAVSPDGAVLMSGHANGVVRFWQPETGAERVIGTGHEGPVTACGLSSDGTWVCSGSDDGTVRVWRLRPAQDPLVLDQGAPVRDVAVGQLGDVGDVIVSAGEDGVVRVWDPRSGSRLRSLTGHEGAVLGVAMTADGRVVSAGADRTLRVWDLTGGEERGLLVAPGDITCVAAYTKEPVVVVGTTAGRVHRVRVPSD